MDDTKTHILKTAFSLFILKSYRDVTMKDIVDKTGLSKGGVYHHFKSKEELFKEVINLYLIDVFNIPYERMNKESLLGFLNNYKEYAFNLLKKVEKELPTTKKSINYYMMLFEAIAHLPGTREKIIKLHKIEMDTWVEIIKKARKNGEIVSGLSDEQVASIFIFAGDSIGMRAILAGNIQRIFQDIIKYWLKFYNEIKAE